MRQFTSSSFLSNFSCPLPCLPCNPCFSFSPPVCQAVPAHTMVSVYPSLPHQPTLFRGGGKGGCLRLLPPPPPCCPTPNPLRLVSSPARMPFPATHQPFLTRSSGSHIRTTTLTYHSRQVASVVDNLSPSASSQQRRHSLAAVALSSHRQPRGGPAVQVVRR